MRRIPKYEENLQKLPPRDIHRAAELERIEREAIANYKGSFDELESALGVLRLGDYLGWKVLVLIHSKPTVRKYEAILGIRLRDFFPPEGPSAERSIGYQLARKIGNFWKVVSGELKIDQRREMGDS